VVDARPRAAIADDAARTDALRAAIPRFGSSRRRSRCPTPDPPALDPATPEAPR
jgi:hypothetical protein